MQTRLNLVPLIARILIALYFATMAGVTFLNPAGATEFFISRGLPAWLAPAVACFELVGGLALATGLLARIVAVPLAFFVLWQGFAQQANIASPNAIIDILQHVAIAGGLLYVFTFGSGESLAHGETDDGQTDHMQLRH